jgi:DeoR/GlpR family transcriptional regulator of sugar metabolism
MKKYNSQKRTLAILRALIENSVTGLTNKELAQLFHTTEATICRDMIALSDEQWIERGKGARWRLSPAFFTDLVEKTIKNFRDMQNKLSQEESRLTSLIL